MSIKCKIYQFKTFWEFLMTIIVVSEHLVRLVSCIYLVFYNDSMLAILYNNINATTLCCCYCPNHTLFYV